MRRTTMHDYKAETGADADSANAVNAVKKVRAALDAYGYDDIKIKVTEETIFTVEDAARAVGAPAEEILKSLVFLVDERPILVLMSGANRVDLRAVAREGKGKKAKMASPEYVFERFGFKVGGVPPTGYPDRLPALLDEDLFRYPVVWAAAGTEHAFFPIEPERLLDLTRGVRVPIKKVKNIPNIDEHEAGIV
jgi:prolyl-tRNA editing enzyme YbaK/EbsC (Cys-tRNA(Pro) deacylase)